MDSQPQKTHLQGLCLRRFCCLWDIGVTNDWEGPEYLEGWLHSTGAAQNPEWDHTGPQRHCTEACWPNPFVPRARSLLLGQGGNIRLLSKVAREAPYPNCWICAHTPNHQKQGLPLVAVAVTLDQYSTGDITSWNLTALNLTHQYLYLTEPTKGPLCHLFTGEGTPVGKSTCDINLDILITGQVTASNSTQSRTYPDLTSTLKEAVGHPAKWQPDYLNTMLLQAFASRRMESFLNGLFWICGHRVYTWISPHMSGSCFVGYIIPGLRITPHLPAGQQRNKREQKTLLDLSDVAANGETVERVLFPAYGAGSNHVDILKLTDILLKFMQECVPNPQGFGKEAGLQT
ncbi:Hypothetical predicted protein [Podarcis lilfordi]|uniref:Uncharacterized protein n=1 Tax=Podarcis lilfordi TaxID=74358 RepID=A0AA35LN58_9SAUR|nr:Hypothetical predicted protein [Podarcis lilfordi]